MKIGSLFSGIGGLELGLERAGLGPVVWQVESDPFCRSKLARHWPNVKRYEDVKKVGATNLTPVDLICGGPPCQPVSVAGERRAQADKRWLWPEFARIVSEIKPRILVLENVPGMRTAGLRDVLADLAGLGFDAEWGHLTAWQLGALHRRRRLFVVATHPNRIVIRHQSGWLGRAFGAAVAPVTRSAAEELLAGNTRCVGFEARRTEIRAGTLGVEDQRCAAADPHDNRRLEQAIRLSELRGWSVQCGWSWDLATRVHDGVPRGMVGHHRRALGNAVVPQCAEIVGHVIQDLTNLEKEPP